MLGEHLYTRRLLMRRIREADLPLILAWSNCDAAFGRYLTPEQYCPQALKAQFDNNALWNRHDKTLFIERRSTGAPLGTIHYWLRQGQRDTAVISIKIAIPEERCKGYGTEAQKFLIIHLFEKLSLKAVEMYTDIDNLAQQRCLTKLGFSIFDSLNYDDRQVLRIGLLFRLTKADYLKKAIYRFHYE